MTAKEVREKYINFFKSPPRNHKEISPAPLVLENDSTTLFTSSGMQPLVPYLLGEPHPMGKRLVNSQLSIRLQDIEEVGDNRHTTFFEMLGNWSLGDYFKKKQLPWFYEFLTKELGLPHERLWVSVFEGSDQVPRDEESAAIWRSLGIPQEKIHFYGVDKNWWSRAGTPDQMPVGEIGGPDSEVFFEFTQVKHDLKFGKECHPNCDCGRFSEIGNSVFMQYKKVEGNNLEELPNKNVDFGGGLERITAAVNDDPDIFKIDLFWPVIEIIEDLSDKNYEAHQKPMRIVADHLRASVMLIADGVIPSNKLHGDVLRSLISGAVNQISNTLDIKERVASKIAEQVIDIYSKDFPRARDKRKEILTVLDQEEIRFHNKIESGLPKFESEFPKKFELDSDQAALQLIEYDVRPFNLTADDFLKRFGPYQSLPSVAAGTATFYGTSTYGLPSQVITPVIQQGWPQANVVSEIQKADKIMNELHKEQSRTQSAGVFKGGLADHSPEVIKLHTATHLLLASLRKVLGEHVVQKGQNITKERSRFDFPNPEKLTGEELKKVEDMINDVVSKDLPVNFKVMPKDEAEKTGAIHAFNEKYGDTVKVYYVGENLEDAFSKEFCGGPHVTHTGEIGRVRIKKQEKIGSGVIRIYAVLDNG